MRPFPCPSRRRSPDLPRDRRASRRSRQQQHRTCWSLREGRDPGRRRPPTPRLAHRIRRGPLRRNLHRRRQRELPRVPGCVPAPRTSRLSHPRRQHHKGRHRTRPQGVNGPGDARVQRAYSQRPKTLQHRSTPDPGAHRRPDHSAGPVER